MKDQRPHQPRLILGPHIPLASTPAVQMQSRSGSQEIPNLLLVSSSFASASSKSPLCPGGKSRGTLRFLVQGFHEAWPT